MIDKSVLTKLSLNSNQYAVLKGSISNLDNVCIDADDIDSDFSGYGEEDTGTVNTMLNGYHMHGDIGVYHRDENVNHSVLDYYADNTGTWFCNSAVDAIWFRNLRSKCVAIPQCKMMNSTVRDWEAIHKVYVFNNASVNGKGLRGKAILSKKNLDKESIAERDAEWSHFDRHISFDVWAVVGAVYGHVLSIYRRSGKDKEKIPCWLYMSYSDLFRILNPEYKWNEISAASKTKWKENFRKAFKILNERELHFDLPNGRWGATRNQYHWPVLMKSFEVSWISDNHKQRMNSLLKWGTEREPVGVKLHIRGSALFDFIFAKSVPRLVQINNFDLKTKTLWGSHGGLCRCFQTIYMNWLVQYRNYFIKHGIKYKTLETKWSQKEMNKSFRKKYFNIKRLSTEEMQKMMDSISISQRNILNKTNKYPAHINESFVIGQCVIGWNLPSDLRQEDVFAKDKYGVAHKVDIENSSVEVRQAALRMDGINTENAKHDVVFEGKHIDTHMATIYRVDGNNQIIQDKYGRCYSFQDGIQSLKSNDRIKVTIDGNKVSEVDYSGLHTRMLYAMEQSNVNGDIYDLGTRWYLKHNLTKEDARNAVKKALLIMINASTEWKGYYAFKKDWNEEHHINKKTKINWLYDLMQNIKSKHSKISKYFCSNKGIELQWQDGIIIRNVCWHFARKGVCALPVHDSLVVPDKYRNEAIQVMQREFTKMFAGIQIPVKVK